MTGSLVPHISSLSRPQGPPSQLWETLSLFQGLRRPSPHSSPFLGSAPPMTMPVPQPLCSQDPPSFLSQAPPHASPISLLNPSFSLLWGPPECSQPSTPSQILPAPQTSCAQLGDPPSTHTHTHLLCTSSSCPSLRTPGVSSPSLEPLPVCLGPSQPPLFLGRPGVPLNPSPCSLAKPPSPWPLFTRTRAS